MILETIVTAVQVRLREDKQRVSPARMMARAEAVPAPADFPFYRALCGPAPAFICEVKKASPSKGIISPDFPYVATARAYEEAGAAAVSVLTERDYFLGDPQYAKEIAAATRLPVLRKDFIVDAYQLYEARAIGAAAVLLIAAILSDPALTYFLQLAHTLGLSVLTECHTAGEIQRAVRAGARIIGINNRNLRDFTVDLNRTRQLCRYVPDSCILVSESGIRTGDDVATLRACGVQAVLIGETCMRSRDKKALLQQLRGQG